MRPLVVMTGQGLAYADGFHLTPRLRVRPGPEYHFFGPATEGKPLDDVFSAARRVYGEEGAGCLARITRRVCVRARRGDWHKRHHREVFAALRDMADSRVVLHVTANIDGIATEVAVKEFGAVWQPVERYREEIPIEAIRQDARDVVTRGRGLLHVPVHGEAGLAAVRGPLEWEGAKRLVQDELRKYDAYSTLAQGMGVQVSEIERLMEASGLGYRLLSALLTGRPDNDDGIGNRLEPADLLTIGYGAGSVPERVHYPFERRVQEARAQGHPQGAKWRALVYKPHSEMAEVQWYRAVDAEVVGYGDGDLGRIVRDVLS